MYGLMQPGVVSQFKRCTLGLPVFGAGFDVVDLIFASGCHNGLLSIAASG